MCNKKILIDLDGVLNEYGKDTFSEKHIPEIKVELMHFGKFYLNVQFYFCLLVEMCRIVNEI